MKNLKFSLLIALALCAFNDVAAAYEPEEIIACNGCSAFQKQQSALIEAYSLRAPQSRVNVIDLLDGSVATFRYQASSSNGDVGDVLGPGTESIVIVQTDASLVEGTADAAHFLATSARVFPAGREGIIDAADLVHHAQRDRIIDDFLRQDSTFLWYLNNTLGYLGGFINWDIFNGIPLRIKFEDGSEVYARSVQWGTSVKFSFTLEVSSAKDADGNDVFTSADDFLRTALLTEQHVNSWLRNADRHGVAVVRSYTRSGSSFQPLQTTCRKVEEGRVKCTLVRRSESSIEPE